MAKQVKNLYRGLAWFFSAIVAAGTFIGCRPPASKYGPPASTKYGPPASQSVPYNLPKSSPKAAAAQVSHEIPKESEGHQNL
ncbi:MAG: hypothetical protein Q8930_20040 [Bacillota bacterium]|nr:hypothetical protein [Bacillota bacterium]